LLHHYRCRVRDWQQRRLPLRLPEKSRLLAVKVDGQWAAQPGLVEDSGGAVVEVPIPSGPSHHLELMYATQIPTWRLWSIVTSAPPAPPVHANAPQQTWRLPPDLVPLHEQEYRRTATLTESFPELALGPQTVLWMNWTCVDEEASAQPLTVVRVDSFPVLAGIATALFLVIAWQSRQWNQRTRLGLLLLWLAASGLSLIWLPGPLGVLLWWPTWIAGGIGGL